MNKILSKFDLVELMNCQVVNCSLDGTEEIIGLHEMSNGVVVESKEMLCPKHANLIEESERD